MTPPNERSKALNLPLLRFNAKLDFVTFVTPYKIVLPALSGKVKWPRRGLGLTFTVHDPSAKDIQVLSVLFPDLWLEEMEVAVDIRPGRKIPDPETESTLKSLILNLFARGLDPSAGADMSNTFRGLYPLDLFPTVKSSIFMDVHGFKVGHDRGRRGRNFLYVSLPGSALSLLIRNPASSSAMSWIPPKLLTPVKSPTLLKMEPSDDSTGFAELDALLESLR